MEAMERLFWVCLGGAAGTGARYLVQAWATARTGGVFPWGTWCVNVVGSFLLGAVLQAATTSSISPTAQATLTIGVLGGFTTYSTFNQETLAGLQRGAWGFAAANVAATLLVCLLAGVAGQAAARALLGGR